MQKSKTVSELFTGSNSKLTALRERSDARSRVLEKVRAALPAKLAKAVVSAGIDQGRLNVGVSSAAWATRLRYQSDGLRKSVGEATGIDITSVRVRVASGRGGD
jgi:hypothetical protein